MGTVIGRTVCALSVLLLTTAATSAQQTVKQEFDKNAQYVQPPVKAGDNGNLLRVNLAVSGKRVTSVDYDCLGNPCGWVHPCDGAQCKGHDVPVELVGDGTAIWWGWSNSGDNCVLVFTIHYQ
jgi:hypothetical protein